MRRSASRTGRAAPEARYERRESLELAFIAALQHIPARQRAVLILREVLGFSAREVADSLETTVASVNSALQRARAAIDERLPEQSQQATLRALGDDGLRSVVESYVDALERADVDAVVAMLTEDATWSMPPVASWYRGHEAIAGFLTQGPFRERWRHLPTRSNGQPAVACYRGAGGSPRSRPSSTRRSSRSSASRRSCRRSDRLVSGSRPVPVTHHLVSHGKEEA
ncbi:MAG: sigma factor-like helix-turn-helix DNA-binding protein [Pseudonocardiaceae bacterium]